MGILSSLLSGSISGILGSVGDVAKVFVGSKQERDKAIAEEMKALQESYKAELLAPERIGYWASFVDGLNRLVRPFFTFGTIALFIWAVVDTVAFTQSMVALQAVPDALWYLIYTIVGFWFGGRLLERAPTSVKPLSSNQVAAILLTQKKLGEIDNPVPAVPSPVSEVVVPVIEEPIAVTPKPHVIKKRGDVRDSR
jgi:hypothetical protein